MTDTVTADVEEVRAAAAALKAAIDRHLAAVEAREGEGENDIDVQQAYSELHDAAQRYDDLLFEVYDEVTPFVLAESSDETEADIGGADEVTETGWVSMLARWDFEIVDRDDLITAGLSAATSGGIAEPSANEDDRDATQAAGSLSTAFSQLVDAYGRDELAARSADFGLAAHGVTTWIVEADPVDDESWMDEAFMGVDEERLLYRLDEVYDDEELVIE